MPRVPRINMENALYYITSRGDSNGDIFKEEGDYTMYLRLLEKAKEQYKFKLFAFCLVPNHAHILIELEGDTTISQIMHALNSNYTKYFSSRTGRKGHLFQERYRMVLAEKGPNLLNLTAYIHLNPGVLGLAQDAAGYPYSSYPLYIEEDGGNERTKERKNGRTEKIEMSGEIREARALLDGRSYRDFIAGVQDSDMKELGKTLTRKAILGSDEFAEKIKSKVESDKEKIAKEAQYPAISKKLIAGGVLLVLALSVTTASLYQRTLRIKENAAKEMLKKDAELKKKLVEGKQFIRKDLDEKYRADMVSYQAMQKRLEIEKKKVRELETNAAKPNADNAQKAVKR